jgi:pyruvate formate lyase activating enzyme
MTEELTGKVYDIQGFSVQDGPGIRTTVFLKGCPLRCPWCHSPESQEFFSQLSWISLRCIGIELCGKCLTACPKNAIVPGKRATQSATQDEIQLIAVDRKLCDNCGKCAQACFPHALFMSGEDYSVQRLVDRVIKDTPFYESSGGGITLSGGEPLYQSAFVLEVLKALKSQRLHIAIDTTGYVKWDIIESILPHVDLFLYDIKHMCSKDHELMTGVPNELILDNARKLAAAGGKMQIRIPLIPHFNDSEKNVRETAEFCLALDEAVTLIQILPYHNLGVMKYLRLDENTTVTEATPHTEKEIVEVRALFESYELPVTVH